MTFTKYYEKLQNWGNDRSREEERFPRFPHLFLTGVGGYIYIYTYIKPQNSSAQKAELI